ncbi:hypothetical protein [Hyalangium rubrum]|uniref:Bacterial surface antigen (D15) domain-containing protein n=1 Tax=Hyalangium rubrum TaxID=3103134 RepID=A0ABU5H0T3_9BACT|nr:hypothetical protein [Hyalangium sp. s54d21]MDY7226734.1 hypothetical protein [Hyalangium sp. s54d21]
MNRLSLLLACLLPLLANAQGEVPDAGPTKAAPPAAPAPVPDAGSPPDAGLPPDAGSAPEARLAPSAAVPICPELDEASEEPPEGLGTLQIRVDGQAQTLAAIEWKGLQRLNADQVRTLTGLPAEGPLTVEQATRGLRRLARTQLFARITPTLRLIEGTAPALEVTAEEHPFVTSVSFQGLQDAEPRELLEDLLLRAGRDRDWESSSWDDDDEEVVATLRLTERNVSVSVSSAPACPPSRPPKEWVAHVDARGNFQPGIFAGGLVPGLEHVLEELRDNGYLLASIAATLHPDGRLEVGVDEGHIEAVEVEGVDADMAPRVREALGIMPGDIFLRSDMHRAVRRLETALPHLEVEGVERHRGVARLNEERGEDGTRRYHTVQEAPEEKSQRSRRRMHVELPWDNLVGEWWHDWDEHDAPAGLSTRGRRVVVNVRTRRPDFDLDLLPVHTQVTGLAPGLEGRLQVWDPRNRAHATLDAAFFIPFRLGGQRIPDDPEQTRRQRRLNWLMGAKVRVPSLGLAELGGQVHDFTDTLDRWRMGAIDSYLYSALLNRPDTDYFRRKGAAAFATWRLGNDWLLGAEYRRDTYATLLSLSPPLTVFRRDSPAYPNAPVTEGRFGSLIGRLEYASDGTPRRETGNLFRSPELSLISHEDHWPNRPALRSFLTLEVGRPAFGGDAEIRFWKLVSDSAFYLPTGGDDSLRLRLRAAGGEDLPLQKREGLGGWSALRGYGFKEFRGDASVLFSAEYRWSSLGAFVDVGTVRQDEGWADARMGLGASLHLGDEVALTAAWRADERATWTPELRLLFTRPF